VYLEVRGDHALVRIPYLLKERLLAVIAKYGVYTDKRVTTVHRNISYYKKKE
jgi:hypothetical protein